MQSDQSAIVGSASPLVFVSCYDTFGNLAHTPHGTEAKHSMYTYRLNLERGDLTLMSVSTEPCTNPAFLRYHPTQNILYACTESIHEEGLVVAYSVSPTTGQLSKLGAQSALGTSTCYLTVDNDAKHLLFVNYWDSTLGALPLTPTGLLAGPVCELLQPPNPIRKTKREDHLSSRQSEDHAHAIVLDPVHGRIAYVPDLGKECVKQFLYDRTSGKLVPAGTMAAGSGAGPHGPRYIEFHPFLNVGYLVNELGSTVSVFEFLDVEAATLEPSPEGKGYEPAAQPTLRLIQMVKTTPSAFPRALNTCGRIAVDPTGQFVLVSNRGHNSLAVFRVNLEGALQGTLSVVGYCHTSGRTPRHFQFDPSGRFLIVANQDTDTIAVFSFDAESGHLSFTGQLYDVPSPNFVCVQAPYSRRLAKL